MAKSLEFVAFELAAYGRAQMTVKNHPAGRVGFQLNAADRSGVTYGAVSGDAGLIDRAHHAGRATLAMLDTTFQAKVYGKLDGRCLVMIDSPSFFRALLPLTKPTR